MHFDKYDHKILAILQEDATLSAQDIGDKVGLSQSQCWRRIERLQEEGAILKRVALLDPKQVGLGFTAFAQVKIVGHGKGSLPEFSKAIAQFAEVLECHVVLGNFDFLLKVVTADTAAYERFFFERLSRLPMVQEVNSMIAMSQIKGTTALPLQFAVKAAK